MVTEKLIEIHSNFSCWFFFSHNKTQIVLSGGEPLFFQDRDGLWFPVLKLLHKCQRKFSISIERSFCFLLYSFQIDPEIMPKLQVDRGV